MPRQPKQPAPAPHPDVLAGGVRRTRHYMHAFIATLKDCGHQPEHVRQVMRELLYHFHGVTAKGDPNEAFRQFQRDRIAEANRHDADQNKPSLTATPKSPTP